MAAVMEAFCRRQAFVGRDDLIAALGVRPRRAGYPKGTRSASLHSVEPRPYTPNIEPHSPVFQSKSGSEKRSRDNATFR